MVRQNYSVRQHLVAFGAALIVPVLGLAVVSFWQGARLEQQLNEQLAGAVAKQIIADVDQSLTQLQAAGQALASSAALRTGNYERFQQRAIELRTTLPSPTDYEVVVRDLTGQQVVNTRVPWGAPLPKGVALELDRQIVETKQPLVQDLFTGATARAPVLSIRVPVVADEAVTHIVGVAFDPFYASELLQRHKLPPGWTATLIDGNNRVIASSRPNRLVGSSVPRATAELRDGLWRGSTWEGDPVLRAFAGSNLSGWRAFVEVPVGTFEAPFWRSLWMAGALGALLLSISLTLALWFGNRVARPIHRLAEAARGLGRGMPVTPVASGVRELDQVSQAMALAQLRLAQSVELRVAKEVAEQASAAKDDFLATISHEIRTPMTGVLGMADLLAAEPLSTDQRRFVEAIRSSGRHLLDIINDVLDFSRIETGKLELEHIDFSIPKVVEEVRSLLAPQAVERGLDLTFKLDERSPPVVKGDPTRLRQVLINFVGNGLKFTNRGGVGVSVSSIEEGDGKVRFRFEVRDSGIGIPKEKQAELFRPFAQADSSTTRQYGGSGLGLAISKRLVEAMGGTLGVDSPPSVGSRFWFEVVFEVGDAILSAEGPELDPATVSSRRILLVEDVELNRQLVQHMLSSHGHEVVCAQEGAEAVDLVARERFDVVLMDVQMPVMDGVEATRRIRNMDGPAREVPIIGLTANVMASEQERYLAAGMNACLTKPIDWTELATAVAVAERTDPGEASSLVRSAEVAG